MVNLKKNVALLVIWFLLAGLALQAAPGTARAQQNGQTISMDFDKVDIRVFIKFISELTGKNFVIDDRIRGRVTILSPRRISAEEAYRVFESVLEVNDFIAVPSGEVTKIVLAKGAKTMALSTSEAKDKAGQPSDTMVTQIIPLTFASSTEVKKLLAPMVSPNGLLTDYPASDTMIVTDYLSNINRLQKIIEEVEGTKVPCGELDITLYRDDLTMLFEQPMVHSTRMPQDISGKNIYLVDDVLYTGRTVRAALEALVDLGRPSSVKLAVIIDRGHRELPIHADMCGKNVPTSKNEVIEVKVTELDGKDEVVICERDAQ